METDHITLWIRWLNTTVPCRIVNKKSRLNNCFLPRCSLDPALATAHHLHVQTIDKSQKFSARKRRLAHLGRSSAGKQPTFQALAPDPEASSLKIQDLQNRPTPVDEDKPPPGQQIVTKMVPHQGSQAVKRLAHISRLRRKPDTSCGPAVQHPGLRSRNTMPSPRSSSTSPSGAKSGASISTKPATPRHPSPFAVKLSRKGNTREHAEINCLRKRPLLIVYASATTRLKPRDRNTRACRHISGRWRASETCGTRTIRRAGSPGFSRPWSHGPASAGWESCTTGKAIWQPWPRPPERRSCVPVRRRPR